MDVPVFDAPCPKPQPFLFQHDVSIAPLLTSLRFTVQDMDNKIRMAKYAVRGAVPARAGELAQQWPDRQECIGIGVAQKYWAPPR